MCEPLINQDQQADAPAEIFGQIDGKLLNVTINNISFVAIEFFQQKDYESAYKLLHNAVRLVEIGVAAGISHYTTDFICDLNDAKRLCQALEEEYSRQKEKEILDMFDSILRLRNSSTIMDIVRDLFGPGVSLHEMKQEDQIQEKVQETYEKKDEPATLSSSEQNISIEEV